MIRWMLRLVLIAGLGWCGYWFIGAHAAERFARDWIAAQSAAGLEAGEQGLEVAGFPNRFDLTLTEPRLADPRAGWGWEAEFLQIFSLSYRPWHVIAAFPPRQTLTLRGQPVTVEAEKLQASVVVEPGLALTLQRSTAAGDGVRLSPQGTPPLTLQSLRLASEIDPADPLSHRIGLEAEGIALEGGSAAARIDMARLDGRVTLSGPLDRDALTKRPAVTALDLREAILNWGEVSAFARGRVETDAAGYAVGDVTLRLENWSAALDRLAEMGLVPTDSLTGLRRVGQVLSLTSGSRNAVELPLRLAAQGISVAGIPVGPPLRFN
ncbi:DUF2125 domain-containing protein [Szabonella alba]|uniref:DUF2125 domain-containing protein n=1 Tax=Szabonella alba TaxID=2804194 RepID=A0A8K0XYT3_9RHOB|nr:DUF2125 domain-containing protein [Szabonella alba]MBL4916395.1 DUF2125 domain-containing protein [Szabonella alba]